MSVAIAVQVRLEGNLGQYYLHIPKSVPKGIARGLNKAGEPTSNKFMREVKKSLGIGRAAGMKSWKDPTATGQRKKQATPALLRYELTASGRKIPLKYFKARETRKGVSATPYNQRQIFAGTFMKGGRFPARKDLKYGDTVWKRAGKARTPLEKQYGPSIPEGFGQPTPTRTWENEGGNRVMKAVIKELNAILQGWAPS